jgi:hypothetical protein
MERLSRLGGQWEVLAGVTHLGITRTPVVTEVMALGDFFTLEIIATKVHTSMIPRLHIKCGVCREVRSPD